MQRLMRINDKIDDNETHYTQIKYLIIAEKFWKSTIILLNVSLDELLTLFFFYIFKRFDSVFI